MLKGVDPGPLFSYRDRTLRAFLVKQKTKECYESLVHIAANSGNSDSLKKNYGNYINSIWYDEVSETKERDMLEYYNKHVKHLRPELYQTEDGTAAVRGLK